MYVRPKKHLGQHFLKNPEICQRIAAELTGYGDYNQIIEIGPGTGALTSYLLKLEKYKVQVAEIDEESITYLNAFYPELRGNIIDKDFLKLPLDEMYKEQIAVVGNFPYNISSQILFKVLDHKELVPEVVGMFQKEVAERVASGPGNKDYGIISVLIQAYYDAEYLFTVDKEEFNPPPKVQSGVIRLKRKPEQPFGCDEKKFKTLVKTAFNQRRKMLRGSIKSLLPQGIDITHEVFSKRPEQLSVQDFKDLTNMIFK
ncbi:MAG: 16S rRNA (adenine(1518)-N(6)/adenine(1519)-N(6))-dimethyltransferase RsmA [Flavobacteriales bacterium]